MAGFSLIDVLCALGLAATLTAVAAPEALTAIREVRALGAARHLAAQLQGARMRAVLRGRDTAVRATRDARGFMFTVYEDGNRNGVLTREIDEGVDRVVGRPARLSDDFPGVDLGVSPGLPGAEGSAPPGSDPVRLGASDSVTFTPDGTATPGSLYLRGGGDTQFVVRIYGDSGRTRILRYRPRGGGWDAP